MGRLNASEVLHVSVVPFSLVEYEFFHPSSQDWLVFEVWISIEYNVDSVLVDLRDSVFVALSPNASSIGLIRTLLRNIMVWVHGTQITCWQPQKAMRKPFYFSSSFEARSPAAQTRTSGNVY